MRNFGLFFFGGGGGICLVNCDNLAFFEGIGICLVKTIGLG